MAVGTQPQPAAVIGTPQRRLEGAAKVRGATGYTADLAIPGLAHARLVLGHPAAARITRFDMAAARAVPGVLAVVTGADLPRPAGVPGALLPLAPGRVFFAGQPVAAVVAETAAAAADAAALVALDYEPLPAAVGIFEALAEDAPEVVDVVVAANDVADHAAGVAYDKTSPRHHNVMGQVELATGDVDAALAGAAHVVSGRWITPPVNAAPLEPHVTAARWEPDGGLTIWTSTQSPFGLRTATAHQLGVPLARVRLIPMPVGGGFGAKTVPVLEPLVAHLARLTGRPVLAELTRTEQFLGTRMAASAVVDIDLGADAEGRLVGLRATAWYDQGAGGGRGQAGAAAILTAGIYRAPAYRYRGFDVATNKPPVAPYRAPTAVPVNFALESAMDELAGRLVLDPLELRLRNVCRTGDPRPDGRAWPPATMADCLQAALAHPAYTAPRGTGEGVGVALGVWLGVREPAAALCRVEPDGSLAVQVGFVDLTGTQTSIAMLAADAFGIPLEKVAIETGDTWAAPYGGSSGGSKTTYCNGPAVIEAVTDARRRLFEIASEALEAAPEDLVIVRDRVEVAGVPERGVPLAEVAKLGYLYNQDHAPVLGIGRSGINREAPMSTVHVCRVRADSDTGEWRITRYVAIQDVGRALNPPEVEGQVHGGALQSVARVTGEVLVYDAGGSPRTASFLDYGIASIDQALPIEVHLLEIPSEAGPLGAKGVGEPPAIPGPAAVTNALAAATGRRFRSLPVEWQAVANG